MKQKVNSKNVASGKKLLFVFKTIIKEAVRLRNGVVALNLDELLIEPYFNTESIQEELSKLLEEAQADKSFYKRHSKEKYEFYFRFYPGNFVRLYDFSDDFLKVYLKDKFGVEVNNTIRTWYDVEKDIFFIYDKRKKDEEIQGLLGLKKELTWLFKLLLKKGEGVYADGVTTQVTVKKLLEGPLPFHKDTKIQWYIKEFLLSTVIADTGFLRKHNMTNQLDCYFDPNSTVESGSMFFVDFFDDFLKKYLEDKLRLGVKEVEVISESKATGLLIEKIEVIKSKNELGRVNFYVNGNHQDEPISFSRNKKWERLYKLANKEQVLYDKEGKEFYDYFNYSPKNPLYTKRGFGITKILKERDGFVLPNIKISMTTENQITRKINSA